MSDGNMTIKVKIGVHEFDAQGPWNIVKGAYDRWLEACGKTYYHVIGDTPGTIHPIYNSPGPIEPIPPATCEAKP